MYWSNSSSWDCLATKTIKKRENTNDTLNYDWALSSHFVMTILSVRDANGRRVRAHHLLHVPHGDFLRYPIRMNVVVRFWAPIRILRRGEQRNIKLHWLNFWKRYDVHPQSTLPARNWRALPAPPTSELIRLFIMKFLNRLGSTRIISTIASVHVWCYGGSHSPSKQSLRVSVGLPRTLGDWRPPLEVGPRGLKLCPWHQKVKWITLLVNRCNRRETRPDTRHKMRLVRVWK